MQYSKKALTDAVHKVYTKDEATRVLAAASPELYYLAQYILGTDLTDEISQRLMLDLWTAYCLHENLDPDTAQYDNDVMLLWVCLCKKDREENPFAGFGSFNNFLCTDLV